MRTATIQDRSITNNAAFPRTPETAQPLAGYAEGEKRVVKLNGSVITMLYTGTGWVNIKVA